MHHFGVDEEWVHDEISHIVNALLVQLQIERVCHTAHGELGGAEIFYIIRSCFKTHLYEVPITSAT